MSWLAEHRTSSLSRAAATAILAALFCPLDLDGYASAFAEVVCWSLVPVFFMLYSRSHIVSRTRAAVKVDAATNYLHWTQAALTAVAALLSSFANSTWIMPVFAFALVFRRRTLLLAHLHGPLSVYIRYSLFAFGIGATLIIACIPTLDTKSLGFGISTAFILSGIYGSLIKVFKQEDQHIERDFQQTTGNAIQSISLRTAGLCAVLASIMLISPLRGTSTIAKAFCVGIMKAVHWTAVFWLTREVSWEIAPLIWAYVASSAGCYTANVATTLGIVQLLTRSKIAALCLQQVVAQLPNSTKGRSVLYIFAIWPALSVMRIMPMERQMFSISKVAWPHVLTDPTTLNPQHPIEELILEARRHFARLQSQQSKTLRSATKEYQRRYAREPPPGFDKWFSYAMAAQSPLVDDFDMINESLKPFWKVDPHRLLENINYVTKVDDAFLRKCGFANGRYKGGSNDWLVNDLGKLFHKVSDSIPKVDFVLNLLDEPRTITTWHKLDAYNTSSRSFENANHRSIWDITSSPCLAASAVEFSPTIFDYGLPFVQDMEHAKDICSHPEFELMYGLFSSPMTGLTTTAPVPILSQAAPSTFGDIVYPSPWYADKMDQEDYKEVEDPLWDDKADELYWAGSTTGSYSWNSSWQNSHRQRFVKLVKSIDSTTHKYLKQSHHGEWTSYNAVEDHSSLFDVKFTAVLQCDDRDCEEQKMFFDPGEREERGRQFRSRFVFDIDENSFSGRYYTLLQSKSAVLKQTILREWHDERLVPWVHYIPISLSMDELPEIMRYMTSHKDGKKRAREIADAGREWYRKALRKEDFTIYLYRLMLELARVLDPNREVE